MVAVKICCVPAGTVALSGLTEIEIAGTKILAEVEIAALIAEVAVMVTVKSLLGVFAGAL